MPHLSHFSAVKKMLFSFTAENERCMSYCGGGEMLEIIPKNKKNYAIPLLSLFSAVKKLVLSFYRRVGEALEFIMKNLSDTSFISFLRG